MHACACGCASQTYVSTYIDIRGHSQVLVLSFHLFQTWSFCFVHVTVYTRLKRLWDYRCVLLYPTLHGCWGFELSSICLHSNWFTTKPPPQAYINLFWRACILCDLKYKKTFLAIWLTTEISLFQLLNYPFLQLFHEYVGNRKWNYQLS